MIRDDALDAIEWLLQDPPTDDRRGTCGDAALAVARAEIKRLRARVAELLEEIEQLRGAAKWVADDMGYKPPEMAAECVPVWHARLRAAHMKESCPEPRT